MFNRPKKPRPLKIVHFSQVDFAYNHNLMNLVKFNSHKVPETGLCYGLTKAWYEYLAAGKSLVQELGFGLQTEKSLIFKITHWQKTVKPHFIQYRALFNKELNLEQNLSEFSKKQNGIESIFSDLNFSEASEQSCIDSFIFENHLTKLEKLHRHQYGLHIIGLDHLKLPFEGHVIGWSFKNNHYILFDSNAGEMYFDDFNLFKEFLCDYVQAIFPEWKHRCFTMGDFYHDNDLTDIKEKRNVVSPISKL